MPADRADAAEIGVKILMVLSPSIAREADLPARAVAVSEKRNRQFLVKEEEAMLRLAVVALRRLSRSIPSFIASNDT